MGRVSQSIVLLGQRAKFSELVLRSTDIEHVHNTSVLPEKHITSHLTGSIECSVVQNERK